MMDVEMNNNEVTWRDEDARDIVIRDYRAFMVAEHATIRGKGLADITMWTPSEEAAVAARVTTCDVAKPSTDGRVMTVPAESEKSVLRVRKKRRLKEKGTSE